MIKKADYTLYFKGRKHDYLFNTLYGTLDQIEKGIWTNHITDENMTYLIKRKHYQTNSQIDELLRLHKAYIQKKNGDVEFVIPITKKCNLNCGYCFQRSDRENIDLLPQGLEKIKQGILEIKSKYKNNTRFVIVLFGGEPLLEANKSIIKEILIFCRSNNIKFRIISNGINVHSYLDLIEFYKNNYAGITITVDGSREQHNKRRIFKNGKGTYEIIDKNIKKLEKAGLPYIIRTNLSSEIVKEIEEGKYVPDDKTVFYRVIENNNHEKGCSYSSILRLVKKGIIDINQVGLNPIKQFYYLVSENDVFYPLFSYCDNKNLYYFSIDGNHIYNCNEEESDKVFFSKIDDLNGKDIGNNENIVKECLNCKMYPICGGGCKIHRIKSGLYNACNYYKEIEDMIVDYISDETGDAI